MKLNTIRYTTGIALAAVFLTTVGCKKEFTDPNNAAVDRITSATGLTGVAIGVQRAYSAGRASSVYNLITTDGFLTRQLNIINQGNTAEYQFFLGGDRVDPTNTMVLSFWTNSNKVIYDANIVLTYAPELGDKNYASGLIAYASIFKALAIANMSMFWEQVPDTTGIGLQVNFIPNTEGFNRALGVVNNALATVSANPISASFLSNIPAGIDIVNTLQALKARYSLYTGNYAQALAAANAVDLTKKSTLNFDLVTLNPIFETATSTNNVYQPIDSTMGLPQSLEPNLADKRVPFYIGIAASSPRYRINGFGATSTIAIPIYLPGEMILTKAEAHARLSNLPDAVVELNKVLTKQPANDPFGVGAGLSPYAGAITQTALLEEIYRQRAIELYMSGLRLVDNRRFNRPVTERKRSFLPYPFQEHDNNPNTPTDPVF
ncbi:RagB/SusD family nutrient uptake outer membrane protein [Longitalea luteola]|uniref:RagB/SusD family nutrient uptake outer membrane protein n=1 Tax=Longitalea luteola TaxID=2812563 RepID=UPI001A970387|nr:RagB/SusD family nutrient uptake outer membrane protein [Longitalea luteola]